MRSSSNESTVSARIIKIAVIAIAMGMVMILIAMGSSLGLQNEIKSKTVPLVVIFDWHLLKIIIQQFLFAQ